MSMSKFERLCLRLGIHRPMGELLARLSYLRFWS